LLREKQNVANRPEPEVEITADLVRALLHARFPALAELELRPLSRGWDNTNWRLGDESIVRVPHRRVAAELIRHEQQSLPALAERLTVAIPAPTHAGKPTDFYPWPWSVTPFFAGTEAASAEIDQPRAAIAMGTFFRQLHVAAPPDAPPNPFRGCPLADRADAFATNLDSLGPGIDHDALRSIFETACDAPLALERVWLHGDLHTRNMIVHDGDLAAVIDWGDICAGDRATDLAGAYMLVPDQIALVAQHAGASETAWSRARGWAVNFAVVYLAHSDDDPLMSAIGQRLLAAVL